MAKVFIINDTSVTAGVDSTSSLGTSSIKWTAGWFSGTVTVGTLSAGGILGTGTLTIGTVSATGAGIFGTTITATTGSFSGAIIGATSLTAGTGSFSGNLFVGGTASVGGAIIGATSLTVGTGSFSGNTIIGGRINLASVASSNTEGDLWKDSTQKIVNVFINGIKQSLVGTIFCQTADATVSNSTDETTVIGSGVGTVTLPANFFTVGKTIRIEAYGFHSAGGNPTIQTKIKLGGTTILDSGAQTSGNSTNAGLEISGILTCRTSGASGVIHGQGKLREEHSSGVVTGMTRTATTTIDLTGALAIDISTQWGTASTGNSVTITNLFISSMN